MSKEEIENILGNINFEVETGQEWLEPLGLDRNTWKQILNYITNLQQENKQLKDLYRKTCEHLFNIGNDELARYFQAQINECPIFTTQILGDKE